MNPKLVVPEKVTAAPVLSFVKIMALLAGAWILSRVMDMHAATAGEIWDHAVQRQGVAVVVVARAVVVLSCDVAVIILVLVTRSRILSLGGSESRT